MRLGRGIRISTLVISAIVVPAVLHAGTRERLGIEGIKSAGPSVRIHMSGGNPVPRSVYGLQFKSGLNLPENSARKFLESYPGVFSIDLPGVTLETRKVIPTTGGSVVILRAKYLGLDIAGGSFSVAVDRGGYVIAVSTGMGRLTPVETTPAIGGYEAYLAAYRGAFGSFMPLTRKWKEFDPRGAKLLVFNLGEKSVLTYEVVITNPINRESFRVYINASNGAFIFKVPNSMYLNRANVYNPNPGFEAGSKLEEVTLGSFVDPDHAADRHLNGARVIVKNCLSDPEIVSFGSYGQYEIRGPLCKLDSNLEADENGDFIVQPIDPAACINLEGRSVDSSEELRACFDAQMDDSFAEVAMYYNTNRAYDFFRAFGFDTLRKNPILAAVNLKYPDFSDAYYNGCDENDVCTTTKFTPFDNAMYSRFDPNDPNSQDLEYLFGIDQDAIMFGQGLRIDFAYDGEVVYHEFTHAVVDTLSENAMLSIDSWGVNLEPGSANEGGADYFSAAISNDPKMGEYARRDFLGSSISMSDDCMRDISLSHVCPNDMWGEFHRDGMVLSHALWEGRELYKTAFGTSDASEYDRSVYESILMWGPVPYFNDVTSAVVSSLSKNPKIGESFANQAEAKFMENNAADCPRFQKLALDEKKELFYLENYSGLIPWWPGFMQLAFDVPEGATSIRVSFENLYSTGGGYPVISVMFRKDEHVEFTFVEGDDGSRFEAVYDKQVESGDDGSYTLFVPDLVPGKTFYVAFLNSGDGAIMQNISITPGFEPVVIDGGSDDAAVDAGLADSGSLDGTIDTDAQGDTFIEVDGGETDTGAEPAQPQANGGCSCSSIGL